ncbi:cellulase family glycosylhydrolase [Paenibacillus lautus]|uniref:cellulase family glycosylhydrolase n=1 Tax=Paenibacillus lautus TaxID=1401 RepID=UPI002DBD7F34|nr:cellulase family glycosylhydrolase [Paenibacillus lautus]MEC0203699.1 cellulase family glycosylhydrolase [Paenibacillus lautus]
MINLNKKSLCFLALIAAVVISLFPSSASAAKKEHTRPFSSGPQAYVNDMQPGWNLGNSLDAVGADETAWGNPRITKALINQIAAQGYKSIRIPVTWNNHIGSGPNYTIDAAYMDRVEEVVDWALDADLYVMINAHHDSWLWISHMENNRSEVVAKYNAVWTQIAQRFRKHSNKLMFESVNEPRFSDGGTTDESKAFLMLDELHTSFHRIVRDSGARNATRPLVLSTLEASPTQTRMNELYNTMTKLNDTNLIATVHYYGFWPFSVNIAGYTRFETDTRNDIDQTFNNVYNTFIARGIPVILGEYGLLGFDQSTGVIEQGEKLKFFEYLTYDLKQKNITHMLWDNGQHFKRTAFTWSDPELYNIMKAGWSGRSSTADTDLVFVKKGAAVQEKSIPLNLNGNTLTEVRTNGQLLVAGQDYTLNGNAITFTSSLLSRLTSSGQFGVNAVLTAKFNRGADWNFRLIFHDKPVLRSTQGTTDSFSIPATINGDQLATMEAVYATGGNAGPQDWTSFKEFEYTFSPSYATGEIKLKPTFFNEVRDGEVILKFHFWSGEVITYNLTKSGSAVTGNAS